ncbi:MAG TPA: MtnX-like HAD-IB family phosphatase [Candidatus Omnitrophota bacterium]|nr:MtnX-like HAD-IB family phosphatase [Candidatus Omnitrophota bacterium]HPS19747.1 MtnX-like HAD-IB family phosphatase [Candidatus Omnitrophota bacterium]
MEAKIPKTHIVFFDFDNTITKFDVIDDMMPRFSKNDDWVELEKKWRANKIGSRECLKGQIEGMSVDKKNLDKYLAKIELDPYFKKLLRLLKTKNVKVVILSDNFDYILRNILKKHGITDMTIFSNKIGFNNGKIKTSFPYTNKTCKRRQCGHCKTNNLLANTGTNCHITYVGDGLSDACPSKHAHTVFSKDDLTRHCRENNMKHIPIKNLKRVYNYFQERLI